MLKQHLQNNNILILIFMVLAVVVSYFLRPEINDVALSQQSMPELEVLIPKSFGDWKVVESASLQVDFVPRKDGKPSINNPYDDSVMRNYVNSAGQIVSLAIAYGQNQRQEVKIHRPELCYYAQGFTVQSIVDTQFNIFSIRNKQIVGKNMLAESPNYQEAVSYWIRIGGIYSLSPWQTRLYIVKAGLAGKVPDGVLVRASSIINDKKNPDQYYKVNQSFLKSLVASLQSPQAREMLIF